jgi:DNA-binding MarR family transcriptional regulator
MQREAGISQFEYLVLAAPSMTSDRRLRLSDIVDSPAAPPSWLSNVVTKPQRAGWIEHEPDPPDGRYTFGVLTDSGMRIVEAAAPGRFAEVRRLAVDPLTRTKQRHLREAAGRIPHTLDPTACDPPNGSQHRPRLRATLSSGRGGTRRPGRSTLPPPWLRTRASSGSYRAPSGRHATCSRAPDSAIRGGHRDRAA